ncbi:MAG: hypothetical protein ACI8UX_002315, partial [Psychromonas sp.]
AVIALVKNIPQRMMYSFCFLLVIDICCLYLFLSELVLI